MRLLPLARPHAISQREPVKWPGVLPHPSPLPLGEGEGTRLLAVGRVPAVQTRADWLPAGEGWGEGENVSQRHRSDSTETLSDLVSHLRASPFAPGSFSLAPVQIEWPRVTIIIPTKPGQAEIPSVEAARKLDYPRERMDIIVARGKQPAIQRNRALQAATGEIIYFLDDDARPAPSALRRAVEHFQKNPQVQMVGGPNLCPPDAPFLEQVFAVVLASWIAFGPSRARYDRVGQTRPSGEKELILCNLLARRAALLEAGGFDEALYPNEENALMDEITKRGGGLIYDPEVVAERRPRGTLRAFCKMLMNYGRGRAEQFRRHPTPGSAMNFVPPLFVLYLFALPILFALPARLEPSALLLLLVTLPGLIYWPVLLLQTLASIPRFGFARSVAAFPLLFATHFFYGVGFWRGLFTDVNRARPAIAEVTLDRPAL